MPSKLLEVVTFSFEIPPGYELLRTREVAHELEFGGKFAALVEFKCLESFGNRWWVTHVKIVS